MPGVVGDLSVTLLASSLNALAQTPLPALVQADGALNPAWRFVGFPKAKASVNATEHLYSFEVEAASQAILAGKQQFDAPGMSWADLAELRAT